MGRKEPKSLFADKFFSEYRKEMLDRSGPLNHIIPDKEEILIQEVIDCLCKIDSKDCTEEVFDYIQSCIEDLNNCK